MEPNDRQSAPSAEEVLESYERYVRDLDDFCAKLREKYWEALNCRPGCVTCCSRELTVFPIEAARIRRHISGFGAVRREQLRARLAESNASVEAAPCPLLYRGRCLVYPARPLLCRTEGYVLAHRDPDTHGWRVTACPKNFEKLDLASEIPAPDLINLESLNQSLAVLNHAYVKASGWRGEERVRLSEVGSP